jgi:dihydrofolate reductase
VSKIYVVNYVTLDGVMQGPGRKEEDTRDGFSHGGWAREYADETTVAAMGARVSDAGTLRLLLGRRSYEGILGYWNTQDHPFKPSLNEAQKYVASTTLREPLPWPNSTLVSGDVVDAVSELKREPGADLCIMGSGELIQTLLTHGLIDEFLLFVVPIVLGTGRRLFRSDGIPARFGLVRSGSNKNGVLTAHYQLAE